MLQARDAGSGSSVLGSPRFLLQRREAKAPLLILQPHIIIIIRERLLAIERVSLQRNS
jgi:hypothetical protein